MKWRSFESSEHKNVHNWVLNISKIVIFPPANREKTTLESKNWNTIPFWDYPSVYREARIFSENIHYKREHFIHCELWWLCCGNGDVEPERTNKKKTTKSVTFPYASWITFFYAACKICDCACAIFFCSNISTFLLALHVSFNLHTITATGQHLNGRENVEISFHQKKHVAKMLTQKNGKSFCCCFSLSLCEHIRLGCYIICDMEKKRYQNG